MNALRNFFPLSFGMKDVGKLIISILIYLVAGVVVGWGLWLLASLPLIGPILGLVTGLIGTIFDIYCFAGIVIAILNFFKIV